MNQKKILIGALFIVILAGASVVLLPKDTQRNGSDLPKEAPPMRVACTMDAKQCPDGSYVGRIGPDCEFEACP